MRLLNRVSVTQLFLAIACVYLLGFFAHTLYLGKTVYGDGIFYYSWLRSVVIDHDIYFTDEYKYFGAEQPLTPSSVSGNKYSVGPGLLWAPAFLLTHRVLRGNGYTLPYQISVGITTVLTTFFALILLWNVIQKYFSHTVSIMTILALAGATNLLYYGSIDAVNSHAFSFFAAALFLSLILSKHKQWFAIGAALGFLGLIRTQDFIYGILLLPVMFKAKKQILRIILGVLIIFLPQFIAWQLLYGKFWVSPYLTGNEKFNFNNPHFFGVLFGLSSGLYLWTPVTILGTVGLFTGKIKHIPLRVWMAVVLFCELYAVSSWSTWWQTASYSGRMFVSVLPIFSFGIASVFSWLAKFRWTQAYYVLTIIGPLSVINGLSIFYFLFSLH